MDRQVPVSNAGIDPNLQPKRPSDFAGFWTEQNPAGNKPVKLPGLPRIDTALAAIESAAADIGGRNSSGVDLPEPIEKTLFVAADARHGPGESQGSTLRPIDKILTPAGRPKHDLEAPNQLSRDVTLECQSGRDVNLARNSARVHSVESIVQRQRSANEDAAIRRVDEASILSSRRSGTNHSSRSLRQGSLLEEKINSNPPHALPHPPGSNGVVHIHIAKEDILFPGSTNRLAQLKLGLPTRPEEESLRRLSKGPATGSRERASRAPSSLPTSPCSSSIELIRALNSSKSSRASKLLRKLKLSAGSSTRAVYEGANLDTIAGKRKSSRIGKGSEAVNIPISQHQKLVKSWEAQLPEVRNGVQSNPDFGHRINPVPTIQSECMKVESNEGNSSSTTRPRVPSQEGNSAVQEQQHSKQPRGSSRWLFRWIWGSSKPKIAAHSSPRCYGAARDSSPTANIMSDARAGSLYTQSDRFASGRVCEKRGRSSRQGSGSSKWGCASHASTAVLTPGRKQSDGGRNSITRSRFQDDINGVTESSQASGNLAGSRVGNRIGRVGSQSFRIDRDGSLSSRIDRGGSQSSRIDRCGLQSSRIDRDCVQSSRFDRDGPQSSRIEEAYRRFQESFRSVGGQNFRSNGLGHSFRSSGLGQSFRSAGGQSFRSVGSSGGGQSSSRKSYQVFEDCHGSFRSIGSPGSYGSFRSIDSPSMRSLGGSNRFPSVESEIEWDSRLPPPLQGDQSATVDVASLCNSSLKFVFKCREIQHFCRFLKTQKKCILRGASEKGNTECFHVILSPGTDIGVSSMVTAMCYAWFLENTVPKVTGQTWHAIPVIGIPRRHMHKHKDAAWLLDACGIDAATLLFADEIEPASLTKAGRIKTSAIGQDVFVTRDEVGSVCTLLGEKLVAEAQCLLEPRYMKTLLLAGVLLDTENLDIAAMRDTGMTTMLLVGSGSLGRNGFFNQLKGVEDDERVSKFIARNYGDDKQSASSGGEVPLSSAAAAAAAAPQSKVQSEEEDRLLHEQFDKDSLFTPSQDQTSTSEAGTASSLDEDSPRSKLQQRSSSFKYTQLKHPSHSAPARTHQLPSPPSAGCKDEMSVAHRRKAATRPAGSGPGSGPRTPASSTRMRKRLLLYQA